MPKADGDATLLIQSLNKAYAATPTNLKIIDLYVVFAVVTALVQVGYMGIVGSLPFNSFLSGVLSCIGTAVLAACLRIQVNKDNKEFKVIHSTSVLELYQTPGRDTIPDFSHLIQGTLTYGNNGKEVKKN
ncbi:dolichyl-diphosphooligosaccharide--protein glycosyltransferase subunit DAD1-like isoform X6 [Triticum dicoccoides]|uniref:dolichyl-diphosphooligosaccharide--protein glycosyltransferase subunit DAD1-like isoform X6 n=1 Tax=Triticum dicoccoides TaxID=85692 RepID=UPI0018912DEC|nr:dolichyl-diphosphooligosaccharide--protein glycosyltransferase subunit DAD1-like isoform X6 [Triticum dicoccoides]XP_044434402.1 dolichyl-diphosphooligosaccharide--protein glycosyltransferase subunit DAD1-like isoform X6 [Triticum aestivum]